MKNKVLSLILALLMAASSASAVLADEAIADVEETAVVEEVAEAGQYDKAISFLANYGIFKGISADDLGADLDVQRYQMALFVARVSTGWVDDDKWEDGPENWSEFTDISEGPVANYWGALSYVNAKGIIEGYGNGKFGPTDGITYQNALTMTVRTLGYTGLEWPWGYIEKAVSLGLTDGITDVAYTDELTRGEVAQIIYNALFAKTKAGDTLAMSSFGIEFGWEKVIVTASDLNTFTPDSHKAELKIKDKVTPYYKDSNKPAAGIVSFQILNDDGTLADDVYYVDADELGLVGEHDDELAVGDAYYVLFEQNKDADLVKVVAYESLLTETLVNAGKTDDEGEEVDYAIEAWLDENTLVSKYSSNNYVNMTATGKNEVMVFTANNSTIKVVTGKDYVFAIDVTNGNILVPAEGVDWKADDYDETTVKFDVKYTYAKDLNGLEGYYTVMAKGDNKDKLYINWIDEDEMEEFFKEYTKEFKKGVSGFNNAAESRLAKSAYAALDLYDTNLDGEADRGIYETYRLGYFENKAVKTCDCGKLDQYVITDVDTLAQADAASEAKEGAGKSTIVKAGWTVREEGVVCDHSAERAWIVDDSVLVDAVDEDGEETGYYAPAYVIYNYDKETGAIKVVKNITDGEDVDSYVAKGIVRGYNVSKKTLTIDDETYDINGYSELIGNGFKYDVDKTAAKAVYGAFLEGLFNQFVEYVVVDGELVHVEVIGAENDEVIVVESYAGLSKDGYIVVNGYSTSDLKYDQFRLATVEGWEEGDFYYYIQNYGKDAKFLRGTVLSIASYDKEEDTYFVNFAGGFDPKSQHVGGSYVVAEGVDLTPAWFKGDTNGYMVRGYGLKDGEKDATDFDNYKTSDVKTKSGDKYIIVKKNLVGEEYATILVYEGKIPQGYFIKGDVIDYIDDTNDTYVFVNAETNLKIDYYEAGLVLLAKGFKTGATYDDVLLGASAYELTAFDFLTGNTVTKVAVNDALKAGKFYYTQGDVVENKADWEGVNSLVKAVNDTFEEGTYVAVKIDNLLEKDADDEFVTIDTDDKFTYASIFDNKKDTDNNFDAIEWVLLNEKNIDTKFRDDKVDSVKYFTLTIGEDGKATVKTFKTDDNKGLANFNDLVEDEKYTNLPAIIVWNKNNNDAVVYIVDDVDYEDGEYNTTVTDTVEGKKITAACTTEIDGVKNNELPIVLSVGNEKCDASRYAGKAIDLDANDDLNLAVTEVVYNATMDNDDLKEIALTSITFQFDGKFIDDLKKFDGCHDVTPATDFELHYRHAAKQGTTSDADFAKALAAKYVLGDCVEEADTYVKIGDKYVEVTGIKEIIYDSTCNLIRGFTLTLNAEDAVIKMNSTEKVEIVVALPEEKSADGNTVVYDAFECKYNFNVSVLDKVTVVDNGDVEKDNVDYDSLDTVEDAVLVNYCGEGQGYRVTHPNGCPKA